MSLTVMMTMAAKQISIERSSSGKIGSAKHTHAKIEIQKVPVWNRTVCMVRGTRLRQKLKRKNVIYPKKHLQKREFLESQGNSLNGL